MATSEDEGPICPVESGAALNISFVSMPNFHFRGIPENLIFNLVIFAICLVVFAILKRQGSESRAKESVRMKLVRKAWDKVDSVASFASTFYAPARTPDLESDQWLRENQGFLSWLLVAARISDSDIEKRCGRNAVEYLKFLKFITLFMTLVCLMACVIIIPINMQGNLSEGTFERTTFGNLSPKQNMIWAHIVLAVSLVPFAFLLGRYGFKMGMKKKIFRSTRIHKKTTIMVLNVPQQINIKDKIRQHFDEAYPNIELKAIEVTYDVAGLDELLLERTKIEKALKWVDLQRESQPGTELLTTTRRCSSLCCCCAGQEVNAKEFYETERTRIKKDISLQLQKSMDNPNPIVFLTFGTHDDALKVKSYFADVWPWVCSFFIRIRSSRASRVSNEIQVNKWSMNWAPDPYYVKWTSLSIVGWRWWIQAILVNMLVFVVMFFFSTPPVIMNMLNSIVDIPLATQWLPSILMVLITFGLPMFIEKSVSWMGYYEQAKENQALVRNVFIFLVLTTIILPVFGLSTADAFIQNILAEAKNGSGSGVMWECVFMPDNGAFFVNLIITATFFGQGLTLLRIGSFIFYMVLRCWQRSDAERHALSINRPEFKYAIQYATLLNWFTICMVFSFICPLITVFGLFFFLLRQYVDRYIIYFMSSVQEERYMSTGGVMKKSPSLSIHLYAMQYVFVALFLQQLFMLMFFSTKVGIASAAGIVLLLAVIFMLITLIWQFYCAYLIENNVGEVEGDGNAQVDMNYVAPSLTTSKNLFTSGDVTSQEQLDDLQDLKETENGNKVDQNIELQESFSDTIILEIEDDANEKEEK